MVQILDVGGEGRHEGAWNLNLSPTKTLGPQRGEAIPRCIIGRADAIPLPDRSVARVIMERSPLTRAALAEFRRVITNDGEIILRHAIPPNFDPHAIARQMLPGRVSQRLIRIGRQILQETRFQAGGVNDCSM